MTVGVVMAGGAGERMRRSGVQRPKPLLAVGGEPLLARCFGALLAAGVSDLMVTTPGTLTDIGEFAMRTCRPAVEARGGRLTVIVEDEPLGSLGGIGLLPPSVAQVLVVNADNLSGLDLRRVLDIHEASGAAMTVTIREELFTMPFGEVVVAGDGVIGYTEKPTVSFTVCSAVSVLGPSALERLRPPRFVMLPHLVNELLAVGQPVAACRDDAPWVDVNDVAALDRAEELVEHHGASLPSLLPKAVAR